MAGINVGGVFAELSLKTGDFYAGLKKAQESTNNFENKLKGMSSSATAAGKNLTAKVTTPITGAATAATLLGMNFQAGMSEVKAISGATGEDMIKLERLARDLGATTKFSAKEAADGLKYMAMAGWTTEQMMTALPGVLDLAAASGEDLGLTSDIVTDSLTAFGMTAKEVGGFVDLLASASSNSNTNVALMGETFKYVAPLFGALGYSAEDAALATGLMANAGIKGSQAGTSLRSAMTRLVKPVGEAEGLIKELGISITDANGEMLPFRDILEQLRDKFAGLTEDQQAQYAATIFGQEAMSGMLAIINASEEEYEKLTKATREYDGAAKEMATTMEDNLQGKVNNLKSAFEEVGLKIFETLLPSLEKLGDTLQKGLDWFNDLDEGTRNTIVNIALAAAAIGPALIAFGSLAGAISKIATATKLVKGGLLAMKGGAVAATAPSWALGGALKAGAVAAGPWVAGAAAIAGGGYLIYKSLSKDALPAVERFGEGVSETTQEAVGSFMDMTEAADKQLKELSWSQQTVTAEMVEDMRTKQEEITNTLLTAIDERHQETLSKTQEQFSNLDALTEEQQAAILEKINQRYEDEKTITEEGHNRINEIMQKAAEEGRAITQEESDEILKIRNDMTTQAVKVMSESQREQKLILEKMKDNASIISAQEAAEVVRNATKKKDEVIAEANAQYDETVMWAIQQRDELGTMSEEEAQAVIDAAKEKRDETIAAAEEMHKKVISEAQAQAGEHVNQVDWETGEIKSKWEVMKEGVVEKAKEMKEGVLEWAKEQADKFNERIDAMRSKIDEWREKAEDMRKTAKEKFTNIKESIEDNFGKVKEAIDGGIGKIKEWNQMSFKDKVASVKTTVTQVFQTIGQKVVGRNAHGTNYWRGGLTWVGEQGRELVDLPRGSKVYSNQKSEEMVRGNPEPIDLTLTVPVTLEGREIARATVVYTAEELRRLQLQAERGGR